MQSALELLAHSDEELARTDPLVMNLLVAKGVPSLADLHIPNYQRQADAWADHFRRRLPAFEPMFRQAPQDWKNDIRFFRLAALHWYVENELGVAYKDDQREAQERGFRVMLYINPSDLFLNGVMDTRRGTCGNMSALYVALGWRLGWPVSLAAVHSHYVLRYDDGEVTHNIEATQAGYGGCKSDPDEYLIREYRLTRKAVGTGSDLRAFTPRELLGIFFGLRARHFKDVNNVREAEKDYLLARYLCPVNHTLYFGAMGIQILRGAEMFDPGEEGYPTQMADFI